MDESSLEELEQINSRLEAVNELFGDADLRKKILQTLSRIGDIERLIAKICTNRATPREVSALNAMLTQIEHVKIDVGQARSSTLGTLRNGLDPLPNLAQIISTALSEDPPLSLADGNVFKKGYNTELDELRDISINGKSWIANLQKTEREKTGISSLKVGFNNVFGYYIEITNAHKDKMPDRYIRKQTMTNAERFITPELKEYEEKILHAEEKILALETRLFNELRMEIAYHAEAIQRNATTHCYA